MKIFVVLAVTLTTAFAAPQQRSYNPGQGQSSGGKLQVQCRSSVVSQGVYKFDCVGIDPSLITLSREHILWLKSSQGGNQQVDVTIPNYRVEELIKAALKSGSGGSTNINILLKKPETSYNVQAQDGQPGDNGPPSVNLQYEDAGRPVSQHYPTDAAYNPLSGPIREPGSSPVTSAGRY